MTQGVPGTIRRHRGAVPDVALRQWITADPPQGVGIARLPAPKPQPLRDGFGGSSTREHRGHAVVCICLPGSRTLPRGVLHTFGTSPLTFASCRTPWGSPRRFDPTGGHRVMAGCRRRHHVASLGRCHGDCLRGGQPGQRPPARPTGLGLPGLHRGIARRAERACETQRVQAGVVTEERAGSPSTPDGGIWTTASSAKAGLGRSRSSGLCHLDFLTTPSVRAGGGRGGALRVGLGISNASTHGHQEGRTTRAPPART